MSLFRKKPVVIEARRVPVYRESDVLAYVSECVGMAEWCGGRSYMMHSDPETGYYDGDPGYDHILIPTLEGDMRAQSGDWIIKGVNGEFYPCKPDIFEKTYEPVDVSSEKISRRIEKIGDSIDHMAKQMKVVLEHSLIHPETEGLFQESTMIHGRDGQFLIVLQVIDVEKNPDFNPLSYVVAEKMTT